MRLLRGDQLRPDMRDEVLRAYLYRTTSPSFIDDEWWLETHAFYVTSKDRLSLKHRYAAGVDQEQRDKATARAVVRRMVGKAHGEDDMERARR